MNDSDRSLIQEIYCQYRNLMYHVARKYFKDNPEELQDAVASTLERLCRYVERVREIPSNKIQAYVVVMVENVCRTRIRQIMKEREMHFVPYEESLLPGVHTSTDPLEIIFDLAYTRSLLSSFKELSPRDQDLIWMRYVEGLDFAQIAQRLNMRKDAVRTALTRSKAKLKKATRKEAKPNEIH